MLALVYLGLAITLGDLICRQFYRFVSIPHRWAAAILVGLLASTWFTYLVGLAFAHTAQPLLSADILFFVIAPGAIFWFSKKTSKQGTIPAQAVTSSNSDWITLGALCAAACVLLIGTLYVTKRGQLRLSGTETGDLAAQLTFAQSVAIAHNFPSAFSDYDVQGIHQFLFYFQAGNLEFLGLNLAWSVDVLSVLVLTSMIALVMTLGEVLFHSRVVGRLGATLFFFHGFLERLTDFFAAGYAPRDEAWGLWKQIAFINERNVPFGTGIFLVILIFLIDHYSPKRWAAGASSAQVTNETPRKAAFPSTSIGGTRLAWGSLKGLVFSGLLLIAMPPWSASVTIATAVALCCLFVAYGCWRLSRMRTVPMLGKAIGSALTVCILTVGVIDLLAIYRSPRAEANYDREPLVKGLVYRNSMIYKIPGTPVTAFAGGRGNGKGQFANPHGLAVDSAGNIFVADTDNGRIEKFSPNGRFLTSMEKFEAPSGIAIDRANNIYVAEIGFKHRIKKLRPNGAFIAEWAPDLYGPRKIAIGPDNSIYVVDSGRNRIVKLGSHGQLLASWGGEGTGDGKFRSQSSVAVDPINNKVYVADPVSSRIQVFDLNGKFLSKWSVSEWGKPLGYEDLAIDPHRARVYTSSAHLSAILVFDFQGNRLATLTPPPPNKLESPSALALAKDKLLVLNAGSARVSLIPLQNR